MSQEKSPSSTEETEATPQSNQVNGSSAPANNGNTAHPVLPNDVATDESPELLRWRAEMLLDEMMAGAADISAGGPSTADIPPTSAQESTAQSTSLGVPLNGSHSSIHPQNGIDSAAPLSSAPPSTDSLSTGQPTQPPTANPTASHPYHQPAPGASQYPPQNQPTPGQVDPYTQNAAPADEDFLHPPSALGYAGKSNPYTAPPNSSARPGPNGYGNSFQQPASGSSYPGTHHSGMHSGSEQSGISNRPYTPPPAPAEDPSAWKVASGGAGDYLSSVPRHTETTHRAEDFTRRDFSDGPMSAYPRDGYYGSASSGSGQSDYRSPSAGRDPAPHLGPVTRQPFADPIAVGAQARRRVDLLPRTSNIDVNALLQEMAALEDQVEQTTSMGRDSHERAKHLLEKSRNILEQAPERSAEVSYYIQQVKSILERAGQRLLWSGVYRRRLQIYLAAWIVLALVVLTSCALYSTQMAESVRAFFNLTPGGIVEQNVVPFLVALSAGILGSAAAALINMWRFIRTEYGFLDRKYGTLGVVLPVIGLVMAVIFYLLFGIIYALARVAPAQNLIAIAIPALLALFYGSIQERIYGTSG